MPGSRRKARSPRRLGPVLAPVSGAFLPLALAALAARLPLRAAEGAAPAAPARVDFRRDVRPILADACFPCHGPDRAKRKGGLSFESEEAAFAEREGPRAIVRGDPAGSELYRRITAADLGERMPRPGAGRALTQAEVETLGRWIEEGARWEAHWAFVPPARGAPPATKDSAWPRGPLDSEILARLEREGLAPSPEAARETLIRRLTLDLTGLPPSPEEVDDFLADASPDAYERLVGRLLASPRHGERMAVPWLHAARYADTNGYQTDGERHMWRWRDWVIDATNAGMPFDRFTVEQIAGDLLPGTTLESRIATGFHRNHRGNSEGGIVPEEYAVEYVADRVETTATVWLGLTLVCARCHDHKYDPVPQRDFYRLFAYFNNVPEKGRAIKHGNSPPAIKSPTREQSEALARLEAEVRAAEVRLAALEEETAAAQARWEAALLGAAPLDWAPGEGLAARLELEGGAEGRIGQAAAFDGSRSVDAAEVGAFGFLERFSCAAWIRPQGERGGTVLSRMTDEPEGEGYALCLEAGRLQVNLVKRWLDDAIRVETEEAIGLAAGPDGWRHVAFTYDGSRVASGVKVYSGGEPLRLKVLLDELNQTFASKEPFRIGAGGGPGGRFRGLIDDVRVYSRVLSEEEVRILAAAEPVTAIAGTPAAARSRGQAAKARACFLETAAPARVREAVRRLEALQKERERVVDAVPTTMVMEEMPVKREAFVLQRGAYDRPGEKVTPGVPACLPPLPEGAPGDRLGLARWLVGPSNPLAPRVAANRLWQMVFGTGIVKTSEDFGAQGEPPSHPELLDRLAVDLRDSGWDSKRLLSAVVTSAAYRQSSRVAPRLLERDPENRLLARGPRLRLSAEAVRDQALASSGLLVERLGGPSVKPYQPAGLWKELSDVDYVQDSGEGLYRRSLYTFWKRTVAPPAMATFDAPGREACCVREMRTNTPLQALTVMNETAFVECARRLAERAMASRAEPAGRLELAFRLVLVRRPLPAELAVLLEGLERHLARYRGDREAALALLGVGESRRDEGLDPRELAAYTAAATTILNLDEAVTKE
ncbi:MAG: DUF1553 domain-containing protein [Planctomycetes bacterium]|nr:DUF1553 domain-containing protein [Planctomycetota bacterium]